MPLHPGVGLSSCAMIHFLRSDLSSCALGKERGRKTCCWLSLLQGLWSLCQLTETASGWLREPTGHSPCYETTIGSRRENSLLPTLGGMGCLRAVRLHRNGEDWGQDSGVASGHKIFQSLPLSASGTSMRLIICCAGCSQHNFICVTPFLSLTAMLCW